MSAGLSPQTSALRLWPSPTSTATRRTRGGASYGKPNSCAFSWKRPNSSYTGAGATPAVDRTRRRPRKADRWHAPCRPYTGADARAPGVADCLPPAGAPQRRPVGSAHRERCGGSTHELGAGLCRLAELFGNEVGRRVDAPRGDRTTEPHLLGSDRHSPWPRIAGRVLAGAAAPRSRDAVVDPVRLVLGRGHHGRQRG